MDNKLRLTGSIGTEWAKITSSVTNLRRILQFPMYYFKILTVIEEMPGHNARLTSSSLAFVFELDLYLDLILVFVVNSLY